MTLCVHELMHSWLSGQVWIACAVHHVAAHCVGHVAAMRCISGRTEGSLRIVGVL